MFSAKKLKIQLVAFIYFFGNITGVAKTPDDSSNEIRIFPYSQPKKIFPIDNQFIFLERGNHRVIIASEDLQMINTFGEIGLKKDELLAPKDFFVSLGRLVYVLDDSTWPIKVFNENGSFHGGFSLGKSWTELKRNVTMSIAANHKGEIFLSQPRNGALLTVYNLDGEILRKFGKLISPKNVYPKYWDKEPLCRTAEFSASINRVQTEIDNDNQLYISFDLVPIIRKYFEDGTLAFEVRLTGKEVRQLEDQQWGTQSKWTNFFYVSA